MYSCNEVERAYVDTIPAKQTISEKVDVIGRDVHEIVLMVNEVSRKLYGSTPKIVDNSCSPNTLTEKALEKSLNFIKSDVNDVMHMLVDILDTL
jgi:hypothetical protein